MTQLMTLPMLRSGIGHAVIVPSDADRKQIDSIAKFKRNNKSIVFHPVELATICCKMAYAPFDYYLLD
jgi:hypothetical protein